MRARVLIGCLALSLCCAPLAAAEKAEGKTIRLFNGKNLDGWYTYTAETGYENPGIFTVVDGMVKILGGRGDVGYFGGMVTNEEYENYHLVLEYKWGEPTYGKRKDRARDTGLLLHCVGPHGPGPWLPSVECNIIEGGTGDIILVGGAIDEQGTKVQHTMTARARKVDRYYYYDPEAPEIAITDSTRLLWYARDPDWKDVVGMRGRSDIESPFGEWTRVEVICKGDEITNIVNGKVATKARGLALTKGKILVQTEGAEVWVRRIELTPLD